MWNHRFAHKNVPGEEKWIGSADFGAGWSQKMESGFYYSVFIVNGEGYSNTPAGTGEIYGGKVGFKFAGGLEITAYHQDGGTANSAETDRRRTLGAIAYHGDSWMVALGTGTGEGFKTAADTKLDGVWIYGLPSLTTRAIPRASTKTCSTSTSRPLSSNATPITRFIAWGSGRRRPPRPGLTIHSRG